MSAPIMLNRNIWFRCDTRVAQGRAKQYVIIGDVSLTFLSFLQSLAEK